MDETYDVVVVGAGLAGLTAAATAAREGCTVLVIDSQANGGRAATDQVGRFRFNRGAHALYRTTPGRKVLGRLGVQVVGHLPPLKDAQGRLGDRVGLLPVNVGTLARTTLLSQREKVAAARVLAGVARWRPDQLADKTAAQWFDDLGLDGALRQLMEMFSRLTSFVVDVDEVSADVVAGQIQAAFRGNVDYVEGGWVTLVDGLARAARHHGARLDTGARVHRVVPEDGRVRIETSARVVVARRAILSVGTPQSTAALLPEPPAAWTRVGPAARVACLDLGLAAQPKMGVLLGIDRPLYLTRHAPPPDGLAPPGGAVFQTMWYLRSGENPAPDQARAVLSDHCRVAGIDPKQAEEVRYLHRMVACAALPTPEAGGLRGRSGVDTGIDGVLVAGDWVGPAGHLADAALCSGEAAGRAAARGLAREPVAGAIA